MKFTQFRFPHGRQVPVEIDQPADIETLAAELQAAGWSFEIEVHPDSQLVYMDCCDEDRTLSCRMCNNGPDVPGQVAELAREAHAKWVKKRKPKAVGVRIRS